MTEKASQKVVSDIVLGTHDGHLDRILAAVRERVLSQATSLRWIVTHPLVTITEDDLTLEEAELIEQATGLPWSQIDPYTSARECRAILTVALLKRTKLSSEEATALTASLTVTESCDLLSTYEVVAGPLSESAPGDPDGDQTAPT